MRILVDIGHPAHVHYYRNLINNLSVEHEFRVIARDRSVIFNLLDHYRIDYVSRGTGSNNLIGKVLYAFYSLFIIFRESLKFKPDVYLSQGGVYCSSVAWLNNKINIATEDTENATLSHFIAKTFKSVVLSPKCFSKSFGINHIKYDSYQELLYLHPNYFRPNEDVFDYLQLESNERYAIVRFVDWNAHHDIGHKGITIENKIRIVREFSKLLKVFILSDAELPVELKTFQIKIPAHKMHDALSFATILFGESSTMASECACLGTPSIFLDDQGRGYTDEEEKLFGLVYNFSESIEDQDLALCKAIELIKKPDLKQEFYMKRMKLLEEKIDPTAFLTWFINSLPDSIGMMQQQSEYDKNFLK